MPFTLQSSGNKDFVSLKLMDRLQVLIILLQRDRIGKIIKRIGED
jgi:hypothetical protein